MRLLTVSLLGLAVAAAGLASCAPTPTDMGGGSPDRVCFYPSTLVNFRTSGENIAYIKVGRNEVYELRAAGFCRGLSAARSLAITETAGLGSRACVGDSVNLLASSPMLDDNTNVPCRARVMRRLTDAEIAALPDRLRPN